MTGTTNRLKTGPYVVTLGTAGGPNWWPGPDVGKRTGIATAVVVDDSVYLVDCGHGVGRQLARAGLGLENLRGIFLTHLHSDHTVDLGSLALFGLRALRGRETDPVVILGPGNRGMLPPISTRAVVPPTPVFPDAPSPGTREMFELLMRAQATDINDRVLDTLGSSPMEIFAARDIQIPADIGYHPNENPTPAMEPFLIFEDDKVKVSAILVKHPPMAPAFGFRFDTDQGSVTISGDTTYTQNMVKLARNTDLLLHEAIDFDWVEERYADPKRAAGKDHHYKSHTSVADAARVANESGARQLALHHLVPGTSPETVWQKASQYFSGSFYLPQDLDIIEFSRSEAIAR